MVFKSILPLDPVQKRDDTTETLNTRHQLIPSCVHGRNRGVATANQYVTENSATYLYPMPLGQVADNNVISRYSYRMIRANRFLMRLGDQRSVRIRLVTRLTHSQQLHDKDCFEAPVQYVRWIPYFAAFVSSSLFWHWWYRTMKQSTIGRMNPPT